MCVKNCCFGEFNESHTVLILVNVAFNEWRHNVVVFFIYLIFYISKWYIKKVVHEYGDLSCLPHIGLVLPQKQRSSGRMANWCRHLSLPKFRHRSAQEGHILQIAGPRSNWKHKVKQTHHQKQILPQQILTNTIYTTFILFDIFNENKKFYLKISLLED